MKELHGKTAFVTGGASGIGLGMARAFGRAGMNVVVADIDRHAAHHAVERLASEQVKVYAAGLLQPASLLKKTGSLKQKSSRVRPKLQLCFHRP